MARPLAYLRVRHQAKRAFDYGWPLALTVATIAFFIVLPVRPRLLTDAGMLKGLRDFISLLVAFFVAALAAVSTVERAALDAPMLGTPPTLDGEALSRRRFLALMFAYLAFVAFALFLAALAAEAVAPSLRATLSTQWLGFARTILGAAYSMTFWNMACTTMLGVWFLVERVPTEPIPMAPGNVVEGLTNKQRRGNEKMQSVATGNSRE